MQEKKDNWLRIESVIRWANMTTNYFARYIGLPRGENLYQIKRGNNGISRDVAERIVAKFPEIDLLWLLTGHGQMFSGSRQLGAQIPFFRADAELQIMQTDKLRPECDLVIPPLADCDLAMLYTGRVMGHVTPAGTIVLLKKWPTDAIIPGEEYVIVSQKIVTLRIVRTTKRGDEVRLVAGDRENYDDMVLPLGEIEALFRVRGKLIVNN